MTPEEYLAHDAVGLADLVRRGETTPDDLLDAAMAATAAVNGALNVVVSTFEDAARAAIRAGLPAGPFRGVPFLLKDLTAHYAGQPTGSAWGPRLNRPAEADTELVKRYKDAGLVIFGKTTVPELAMDWSTESRAHG
ncbi:MAG: amidase, partial [Rhodobacteraceae bacterium]|nr:amidase [Paracoccaceae bacterium]